MRFQTGTEVIFHRSGFGPTLSGSQPIRNAKSKGHVSQILSVAAIAMMLLLTDPAWSDAGKLPLYEDDHRTLTATFAADLGYFAQDSSWFGASQENLGEPSGSWWEVAVTPGLEFDLESDAASTFCGRVSAAGGYTWNGVDAAGSNAALGGVTKWLWEDAYLGWRGDDVSGALGLDSLELSAGRRKYQVGTGFLFWGESSNGGDRGAYWVRAENYKNYIKA